MRILGLIISLVIMAWLAYFTITRVMTPDVSTGIKEGDTIIDAVDYAKDAADAVELRSCLQLCAMDLEKSEDCETTCKQKYK